MTSRTALLVGTIAFLAYGAVLWNGAGFSQPDDTFAGGMDGWGQRPLLTLTYAINRHVGGWMAVNLSLHILAAILVLSISENVFAGMLFAAHPMATDAVASIAGRSSLLCAVCILASLFFLKSGRYVYWLLFAGLGFFAKQEAVAILLLSPMLLLSMKRWRQAVIVGAGGFILGSMLFIAWRPFLIESGKVPALVAAGLQPAPPQREFIHRFASAVGNYVVPSMFIPANLSVDPDIHYSKKSEIAGWLLMPMVLPMIPYAFAPLPDVFIEHRAYLSLAACAILIGWILKRAPFVVLGIVLVFIIGTNRRVDVYSSPTRLWEDAVQKSPLKGRPHMNLGVIYASQLRYEEARMELMRTVQVAPELTVGWRNLVTLFLIQGDMANASLVLDAQRDYLKGQTNASNHEF